MKNTRLITLILLSLLLFSFAVSAAQVQITPQAPIDSDDLTCNLNGVDQNDWNKYNFKWYQNGLEQKIGNIWIFPNAKTNVNDQIMCQVWSPFNFLQGTDIVTINPNPPVNHAPDVKILQPNNQAKFSKNIVINFLGTSSDPDGDQVTVSWDFGDGSNAGNILNPSHSYTKLGQYLVTLRGSDPGKLSDSDSILINIEGIKPVAVLDADKTDVKVNEQIQFSGVKSSDKDGKIISYSWNFGDGNFGNGVNIQHSFNVEGTYTVTLTVTDDDGLTGTATKKITVSKVQPANLPPVAVILTSTLNANINELITFDGTNSFDPDGKIVNYFWDFGDGSSANGANLQHSFNNVGIYTVTLTVTDDKGAKGSANVKINIKEPNQLPVAVIDVNKFNVVTNEIIDFSGIRSFDVDGIIVDYSWDFNDGLFGNGANLQHSFNNAGVYLVTLTVTDDDGAKDSETVLITVNNQPPVNQLPIAVMDLSKFNVFTNEVIDFSGSRSFDVDGIIVNYFWDFGDGSSANGANVQHSYNAPGLYFVGLTVTDDDGAKDSELGIIIVNDPPQNNQPPVAVIDTSNNNANTREDISFVGLRSFDVDGIIVDYSWDFNDGLFGNGANLQHSFNNAGVYLVTLTVTDDDGAKDSETVLITVNNQPPVNQLPIAVIDVLTQNLFTNEQIDFSGSRSFDVDGEIVDYSWIFGDGNIGNGINTQHTYNMPGLYFVSLIVTDNSGDSDIRIILIEVKDKTPQIKQAPTAVINTNTNNAFLGFPMKFSGTNSFDLDGKIVNYFWDFGDGSSANGANVQHIFFNKGLYTVTLTVTDDDGLTGTTSVLINAGNVNRDQNPDKPRVGKAHYPDGNDKNRVNSGDLDNRDIKISNLMPLNYKKTYAKGENFVLLAKLKNEGSVSETVDLKLTIPEFNYVYFVRNINVEPSQVKFVMLNIAIPANAAPGLHLVKVEMNDNEGNKENNDIAYWEFTIA